MRAVFRSMPCGIGRCKKSPNFLLLFGLNRKGYEVAYPLIKSGEGYPSSPPSTSSNRMSARTGQWLGSTARSVLFAVGDGEQIDDGIGSAVLRHLQSQLGACKLTVVTVAGRNRELKHLPRDAAALEIPAESNSPTDAWECIRANGPTAGAFLVVLDSMQDVIATLSVPGLARLLHFARVADQAPRISVAAFLHEGDFPPAKCTAIRSLFDSVVRVRQRPAESPAAAWDIVELRMVRCKPSGRVAREVIVARFVPAENCLVDATAEPADKAVTATEPKKDFIDGLNLSFNVGLTDAERARRAAVALPYMHRDAAIADAGLALHPDALQITGEKGDGAHGDSDSGESSSSDEGGLVDEDGEEIFSEDV